MSKFQINGTIIATELDNNAIVALSNVMQMKINSTKEGYLLKNKQGQLLIELPLIQGQFESLEGLEKNIKDSLGQFDCLFNIEVYEQNGRPIDRWQG